MLHRTQRFPGGVRASFLSLLKELAERPPAASLAPLPPLLAPQGPQVLGHGAPPPPAPRALSPPPASASGAEGAPAPPQAHSSRTCARRSAEAATSRGTAGWSASGHPPGGGAVTRPRRPPLQSPPHWDKEIPPQGSVVVSRSRCTSSTRPPSPALRTRRSTSHRCTGAPPDSGAPLPDAIRHSRRTSVHTAPPPSLPAGSSPPAIAPRHTPPTPHAAARREGAPRPEPRPSRPGCERASPEPRR